MPLHCFILYGGEHFYEQCIDSRLVHFNKTLKSSVFTIFSKLKILILTVLHHYKSFQTIISGVKNGVKNNELCWAIWIQFSTFWKLYKTHINLFVLSHHSHHNVIVKNREYVISILPKLYMKLIFYLLINIFILFLNFSSIT